MEKFNNSVILHNILPDQLLGSVREIVREELEKLVSIEKSEENYKTRKETSRKLKISLPTLDEYTRKGIIVGHRVGSRVLYSEADIQEAVKSIPTMKYRRIR